MKSRTENAQDFYDSDELCTEMAGRAEISNSAELTPVAEIDESSDLDDIDPDDERWDAFIADDDERDPQPDYGDFWFDD